MTPRSLAGGVLLATLALAPLDPTSGALARSAVPTPTCGGLRANIVGTDGGETILGTPGRDVIVGLGGYDKIRGLGGDDVLCGSGGDDLIAGGGGADVLYGLGGADRLVGQQGDDRLFGGRDSYVEDKYGPIMDGDALIPGPGNDRVDGGYDRRRASGGQTPDTVYYDGARRGVVVRLAEVGGVGTARGQGRDSIVGSPRLAVVGSAYDDRLVGTSGTDYLTGNGGDDLLIGRSGADSLGDGDRHLEPGDATRDELRGGRGRDAIWSSQGPDRIVAGPGDDSVAATAACPELLAGTGDDRLFIESLDLVQGRDDLVVDARTGQVTPAVDRPACGLFHGFESYQLGGGAATTFYGTEGPDRVAATGGPLTAYVLGGDDNVVGSAHDDVVYAAAGDDTVDGGRGRDACVEAEHVLGCEGDQYPFPAPSCDGRVATIVATEIDATTVGTPGDDVILGSATRDSIDGLGGDDVICGSDGADTITGGSGDDRIFGGNDSYDSLDPGTYSLSGDRVRPGPGDDYVDLGFDVRHLDTSLNNNTSALDELDYSRSAQGVVADLTPVAGLGTVTGQGSDTIVVQDQAAFTGSGADDTITGGPGVDWIAGRGGDDVVDGAGGDDQVYGDVQFCCGLGPVDHDIVRGGAGDDELGGTRGRDEFDGGEGDDEISTRSPVGAISMQGGAGDDDLSADVRPVWAVSVDGGPGRDTLGLRASRALPSRSRLTIDVLGGEVRSSAAPLSASVIGFESYLLDAPHLRLVFWGSELDEEVDVNRGTSLRASTAGGDDLVYATVHDDRVDGGSGRDTVWAYAGTDTCRNVERTRGCEVFD